MVNLPVPYSSQHDDDARLSRNDCGPTSIKMILNHYGENASTDQIFQKTGAGQGLISFTQMKKAIASYGYQAEVRYNQTPEHLKALLDSGIPPIALVHYGSLDSRQDKAFNGGHFFTVVGYRDDGYFVNDPNFQGQFRSHGDHHFYTKREFENAWRDCHLDGNPRHTLLVIQPKQPLTQGDSIPVNKDVFETLVTKATSLDRIADGFGFDERERSIVGFGEIVWNRINDMTARNRQLEIDIANLRYQPTFSETPVTDDPIDSPNPSVLNTDIVDLVKKLYHKVTGGNHA